MSDILDLLNSYDRDTKNTNTNFSKTVSYKDMSLEFQANPFTKDLNILEDEDAIKNHLKMLFELEPYDKLFHPEIYTGIRTLIFDNFDSQLESLLRDKLILAIRQWEPRIDILNLYVESDDNVYIKIDLRFKIKGKYKEIQYTTLLKRAL